jgi:hypothetical protein
MSGKYSQAVIPCIRVGGAVTISLAEVANIVASSFSVVTSSENYDRSFSSLCDINILSFLWIHF